MVHKFTLAVASLGLASATFSHSYADVPLDAYARSLERSQLNVSNAVERLSGITQVAAKGKVVVVRPPKPKDDPVKGVCWHWSHGKWTAHPC